MSDACARTAPDAIASQGCLCVTVDASGAVLGNGVPLNLGAGGPSGPVDPATGIAAGALNPAVTIAASQITGASPVDPTAGIAAGALNPAVTVAGTQLTGTAPANFVDPATGIAAGALNPAVTVAGSQITGTLPNSAIPCGAVIACVAAAPAGSIPASAIAPGTAGQVLTTNAAGQTTWAAAPTGGGGASTPPTAAQISTAMSGAAAPASPATGSGVAKVHASDASGAPVAATPQNIVESAIAGGADASPTNPIKRVSGVNASGAYVDAAVIPTGAVTVGTSVATPPGNPSGAAAYPLASVTAPVAGLYAIHVYANISRTYGTTINGPAYIAEQLYIVANGGQVWNMLTGIVDLGPGDSRTAGSTAVAAVYYGIAAIVSLAAGAVVDLGDYVLQQGGADSVNMNRTYAIPSRLELVKLADNYLG